MTKKDFSWLIWGLVTCITFGVWQQSVAAAVFAFYAIVFTLMTIAGWDEPTSTTTVKGLDKKDETLNPYDVRVDPVTAVEGLGDKQTEV